MLSLYFVVLPHHGRLCDHGKITSGLIQSNSEKKYFCTPVLKVIEGRPNIVDHIKSNEIQLVINTTEGKAAQEASYSIRRAALVHRVPYFTTLAGATAATRAIEALRDGNLDVKPMQEYYTFNSV